MVCWLLYLLPWLYLLTDLKLFKALRRWDLAGCKMSWYSFRINTNVYFWNNYWTLEKNKTKTRVLETIKTRSKQLYIYIFKIIKRKTFSTRVEKQTTKYGNMETWGSDSVQMTAEIRIQKQQSRASNRTIKKRETT